MFADPRMDLFVVICLFSAASAFIGYWQARGKLEPELRRLARENRTLRHELAEATDTLDNLLDAAVTRHPANGMRRPGLAVITGGAS